MSVFAPTLFCFALPLKKVCLPFALTVYMWICLFFILWWLKIQLFSGCSSNWVEDINKRYMSLWSKKEILTQTSLIPTFIHSSNFQDILLAESCSLTQNLIISSLDNFSKYSQRTTWFLNILYQCLRACFRNKLHDLENNLLSFKFFEFNLLWKNLKIIKNIFWSRNLLDNRKTKCHITLTLQDSRCF